MRPNPMAKFIPFVIVLLLAVEIQGSQQEVQALLSFKQGIVDEFKYLASWKGADSSPCESWTGISCSSGLVTRLDIGNMNLSGIIGSSICNLSSLIYLSLNNNAFAGDFPSGLLSCNKLETLELQSNKFGGPVPADISALSSLRVLDLSDNGFSGKIPTSIGQLSRLEFLSFWNNKMVGPVPTSLGALGASLKNLSLSYNSFGPSLELGNLTSLRSLKCGGCDLRGPVPTWLGKLQDLEFLELTYNSLTGGIPLELTTLSKLKMLELYSNSLTGEIPKEIGNLVSLTDIDLNSNSLSGVIPEELFGIANLSLVHLWNNSLTGKIPENISQLPKLYDVALFQNQLNGTIPVDLGSKCTLEIFDVSTNRLTGQVPPGLCNGGKLWRFMLFSNDFSGVLPDTYSSCKSLIRMRIHNNRFSGSLPSGIWGLPLLFILDVSRNGFDGDIGIQLGDAASIQILRIFSNRFTGSLPASIGNLMNLHELNAGENIFSGFIPQEVGKCASLTVFNLSSNHLQGNIPSEVGSLSKLQYLDLSGNGFEGSIPGQIGDLSNLIWLDLSKNQLSGRIPVELSRLPLAEFIHFNMSFNRLEGAVPFDISSGVFEDSFVGNEGLCISSGCPKTTGSSRMKKKSPGVLAWVAGAVLAFAALASFAGSWWFYAKYKTMVKEQGLSSRRELMWTMTAFQRVSFDEQDVVLACLDEDNVIGFGGAGKVYRASLTDGRQAVAVKKLWSSSPATCKDGDAKPAALQQIITKGDYGFRAEVESLGRIRHFNIVRLLCCVSNGETNMLVYDYMPNGSLGDLLHGTKAGVLDWPTRYRIALGAAQGLSYLHHDCVPPILHRDVKSNNILLSDEFDGLLADFGLAKLLDDEDGGFSVSSLTGSLGYMAPEYAHKLKVTEKSDIYSYGVVLMELLTGKRPLDEQFEGLDIVTWVCERIKSREDVMSVFDTRIVGASPRDLMLVLKIALHCTSEVPSNRPSMREVVQMLRNVDPNSCSTSADEKDDMKK